MPGLLKLQLQNFRGFANCTIPFRDLSIIVGRNNAGKSTIIEALRLVSLVSYRYRALSFEDPPDWLDDVGVTSKGVSPSIEEFDFSQANLFHRYGPPPARIEAAFEDQSTITIYVGPDFSIFGILRGPGNTRIASKSAARQYRLPLISVMPPIGELRREETILAPRTVRRSIHSRLAPLHFRNQLRLFGCVPTRVEDEDEDEDEIVDEALTAQDPWVTIEELERLENVLARRRRRDRVRWEVGPKFEEFQQFVEQSWPAVRISSFDGFDGPPEGPLDLMVREGEFTAEAAWMGQGLQAWLQVAWFLVRAAGSSTIVLDEPDVYLHPDLQRKTIRLMRGFAEQAIVATHSTEILSEVAPENVLLIDRRKPHAQFASTIPHLQGVVAELGGAHNLQLTRLWTARKCVFVEGEDFDFVEEFHRVLFPTSTEPLGSVPHVRLDGTSNWGYSVGSARLLRGLGEDRIRVYCILDRDFRTEKEIERNFRSGSDSDVDVHIWKRKEIENYLLVPTVIVRHISSKASEGGRRPSIGQVEQAVDSIAAELKDSAFTAYTESYLNEDRRAGLQSAHENARRVVDAAWETRDGRLSTIAGKMAISKLSDWSQREFRVSISPMQLAREIRQNEVDAEVRDLITAIDLGNALPRSTIRTP